MIYGHGGRTMWKIHSHLLCSRGAALVEAIAALTIENDVISKEYTNANAFVTLHS